jgi:hypothetical protein
VGPVRTHLFCDAHLFILEDTEYLPRQARDKHRKKLREKETRCCREIRTHTEGLKTLVYYGDGRAASASQLAKREIVLTTYDVLVNDDESSTGAKSAFSVFCDAISY